MIMSHLEEYDYAGASAIASVMLLISFVLLLLINKLQAWSWARIGGAVYERLYCTSRSGPGVRSGHPGASSPVTHEPVWVKWLLVTVGLGWFAALLLLPLATVFIQALSPGLAFFWHAISEPDALSALGLTALVTLCSVPLNLLFGLAAAWAIARFRFPGRQLLITLIDLPFSVSPVIAGLMFVLLFGSRGWFGEWLSEHDIKIIFATRDHPGDHLHHCALRGTRAAAPDGGAGPGGRGGRHHAGGEWVADVLAGDPARHPLESDVWPAALYRPGGGEFGAVSVVSGHIRGQTNTLPLHIEILYNEYQTGAAFAVASLLALFGIFTLLGETLLARLRGPTQSH